MQFVSSGGAGQGVDGCSVVVVNDKLNNLRYKTVLDGRNCRIYILRGGRLFNNYFRACRHNKRQVSANVRCVNDLSRKRVVGRCFHCFNVVSGLSVGQVSRRIFSQVCCGSTVCSCTVKRRQFVRALYRSFPRRQRGLGQCITTVQSIKGLVDASRLGGNHLSRRNVSFFTASTTKVVTSIAAGESLRGMLTTASLLCNKVGGGSAFCRRTVVGGSCLRDTCHFARKDVRIDLRLVRVVHTGNNAILGQGRIAHVLIGSRTVRKIRIGRRRVLRDACIVSGLRPRLALSLLSGGRSVGPTFISHVGSLRGDCKVFALGLVVGGSYYPCRGRGVCLRNGRSM